MNIADDKVRLTATPPKAAPKKNRSAAPSTTTNSTDGPSFKILLWGAAMMAVVSLFVAYYLPPKQTRRHEGETTSSSGHQPAGADSNLSPKEKKEAPPSLEELTSAHADAVRSLVDALEKGAKVSLSKVHLAPNDRVVLHDMHANAPSAAEALLAASSHPTFDLLTAARDIAAGEPVFDLPAQLQFNERTMSPTLRKGIAKLAQSNPAVASVLQAPAGREYTLVLSLILSYGTRTKNQWGPWLATLPGSAAMESSSGLFLSSEDAACLCPFDQRLVKEMRRRRDELIQLVNDMCVTPIDDDTTITDEKKTTGGGDEKLSPEKLAKELACRTTPGQLTWAYAVFLSRQINFHGLPSMFPLMEILPYAVSANVRPGAIHTNEKGQYVSVDLAAATSIGAGDELTFRMDVRHPSDVFFSQGYHDPQRHYGPLGLMLPMAWSSAVHNVTAAPEGASEEVAKQFLQCGTRDATFFLREDGTVHPDLWRCAELDRAFQAFTEDAESRSARKERSTEEEEKEAAPQEEVEDIQGFIAYLAATKDLSSPQSVNRIEATEETIKELVKVVRQEYLVVPTAEGGGGGVCGLTDRCVARRMCRELMEHNAFMQNIVEKFTATAVPALSQQGQHSS